VIDSIAGHPLIDPGAVLAADRRRVWSTAAEEVIAR
jgi:hypothetical protein